MNKKTLNTILYAVVLLLFILLFIFTGSSKSISKQLNSASAEQSISNAEAIEKLQLKPYNELQNEVAGLQAKANDSTNVLYFKKSGKTVTVQLIDNSGTATQPIVLTLNATDAYNFNFSEYSNGNFAMLTNSNIGNVALTANSKWTESKYASANFPKLLGWNAAFAEKFKTLRKQKVTQNNAEVNANNTKSIHFFLWSTIEYMKSESKDKFHYTIAKDNEKYTVTSEFFEFDHKEPKVNHKNDSIQQIKDYKDKFKNATLKSFVFTKNGAELTLVANDETISIPIRSGDATSITTIGKVDPTVEETTKKVLAPILTNLKKTNASFKDWNQNQYKKESFSQALDLPISTSRWKQFIAVNKAEDLFDFFMETIAFQLDETNNNTVTLEANTISHETTSTLSTVGNSLLTRLLLGLGVLTSLFLLVKENVFNKTKVETESEVEAETEDRTIGNVQEREVVTETPKPTKTDAEIIQQKLNGINSLHEVSKLPWKSGVDKELRFLIEHQETSKKIISAKDKDETAFLKTLKEVYPSQIEKLASQKENAELWNAFTSIKDKGELKSFLKKKKEVIKGLPNLLEIGFKYESIDNAKTFAEALKILEQDKKFKKDVEVLLKLKEKYPNDSIDTIITATLSSNSSLRNGADKANSISELLQHLNTWYKSFSNRDSKWKPVIDDISKKQQAVQTESNTPDKLHKIEEAYNLVFNGKEKNTEKLLSLLKETKQKLQQDSLQQVEAVKKVSADKIQMAEKTASDQIATIKSQAKQAYEALEVSKKATDNNNKLAEKYFANLYDPHIKEFQNKARDFDNAELTKRLAFIAFNAMDLAKFVNDNWSADNKTEGNIRRILKRESLTEVPKENFDPNTATSYINTIVAFLHKNGVNEIEHLIDGIDINEELKGLH